ncbi:uncharacterized protein LOC143462677 [Clavelina lepadiformis]|uniref:uncharacterized protein LOC143462677 n=1 Tax=Clavelina lepadiformis TaxID=159417 RepID=UPI004041ED8A
MGAFCNNRTSSKNICGSCCSFNFPDIPTKWMLFVEFAFTFGTTLVYFADIITDIITLQMYYEKKWYHAFGFSICFIVLPSVLLAILEYQFLRKTYGKSISWKVIAIRTILNVPFQLTVIWYHCQLTYTYFRNWLNHIRGIQSKDGATTAQWYKPTTLERSRGASLSSLNELDYYQNTEEENKIRGSFRVPPPQLSGSMGSLNEAGLELNDKDKDTWWKRLTREQWLSHLNKQKLIESMLESLPQLLINVYLIAHRPETLVIQYISAVLSYISLCGGVVRYDKTRKDNEADRWMVDRTLVHSRAFNTRLEWPQILFISLYKGAFLAARILALVFFTIYFQWYILGPVLLHWAVLLCYFIAKWYPDFSKVTRQLRQADYNYRAYIFLSHDFISVLTASFVGIFIHVRPYYHAFIDQPYCFMFWYYVIYVAENICLFLTPGIVMPILKGDDLLTKFQYYGLLATDLVLNVVGCVLCATYYLAVHKMRAYTAHAYPSASKILCCCCFDNDNEDDETEYWLPVRQEWTICKQAETSELFLLTKEQLKSFQQTYNTMVRNDKRKGRTVECFLDDRCKIFYAPRSKMKKLNFKTFDDETPRPSLRRLKDASHDSHIRECEHASEEDIMLEARMQGDRLLDEGDSGHSDTAQTPPISEICSDLESHTPSNITQEDQTVTSLSTSQRERPVRKPRVKSLNNVKTNPVSGQTSAGGVGTSDNTKVDPPRPSRRTLSKSPLETSQPFPIDDASECGSSSTPRNKHLLEDLVDLNPPVVQPVQDVAPHETHTPRSSSRSSSKKSSKTDHPPHTQGIIDQSETWEASKRQSGGSSLSPSRRELSPNSYKRPSAYPEIDDSTYRVARGSKKHHKAPARSVEASSAPFSEKSNNNKVHWKDHEDPSQTQHENSSRPKYHNVGEVVDTDNGWQQTWI